MLKLQIKADFQGLAVFGVKFYKSKQTKKNQRKINDGKKKRNIRRD